MSRWPWPTVYKRAEDIQAGDAIVFLGRGYLVGQVEPYEGPFDFIVGIARSADGWGMSLEAGSLVEVGATVEVYQ